MEERRSYWNFAGSAALHGALLAMILLGLASAPPFDDNPEAIPVETVSLSDLTQIVNGEKDAKPAPPDPPPDQRAATEPAPPEPAPAPPPEPAPAPKPEAAPTPPPKAETPPPKPAPPKAEATPKPDSEPPPQRPQPPPPRAAAQQATVQPPVRPKEPAPERPKPQRNFDPNSIAKLIGQTKTASAAPTQTAGLTPQGLPHHDAPHMSMSLASALDAWLTESYLNCWTPPPSMPGGDTYVAQIKVVFNPDGSLSGRPVLLNPPSDPAWRAHAESAMRAVRKCDPLKVPAQYVPYFEEWKIETIHFDPRETQG